MSDLETRDWYPDAERVLWLATALTLVLLPHVARIPAWISAVFVLSAGWRVAAALGRARPPGRALRFALSVAVVAGVGATFGTVLGRNAGVALLVALAGMKVLETRTLRDAFVLLFLGYFLVVTNFLYSQSIPTGLYMLVVVLVLTGALSAINGTGERVHPALRLRHAGVLLVQAVPLMLALFVLFPRVSGPLWGLPEDAHSAVSGLGDTMSPGRISQLGLSDEVAFRVDFAGRPPPPSRLYWRGPVLTHTDGETWSAAETETGAGAPVDAPPGRPVEYAVTLEPHQERWLFALELPVTVPPGARMSADARLLAAKPVRERVRYELRSDPTLRPQRAEPPALRDALRLPDGRHPRARDLARRWRRETGAVDRALVDRALAYFGEEAFYYTLRPPLLSGDTVDEFLFGTRRGFCEHYAAAFAVLMRAGGVPARVVTGYQGGEMNPLGDYLIVRQRDAHAWVEVWLEGQGWLRVDPTAAVSPDRIEIGIDAAIPPRLGVAGIQLPQSDAVRGLWRRLRHTWDSINNAWNLWVLGYGPDRQQRFLDRLGLDAEDWRELALVLSACVAALLAVVGLWVLRPRREEDRVLRDWQRFCAKLAARGVRRRPGEGPVDFCARAVRARPRAAREVRRITELYVRLRYGDGDADPRELRRAVAGFRA